MCALEILHVDEALVVSNKPSGLLAVPGRGPQKQDCLSARVQRQFDDALIVHRLDMGTSGLMILARGLEMQRRLQRQFALGQVNKGYVAVVSGRPDVPAMQWQQIDAAMRVDWPNRPRSMIDPVQGKASRTRWRLLDRLNFIRPCSPLFSGHTWRMVRIPCWSWRRKRVVRTRSGCTLIPSDIRLRVMRFMGMPLTRVWLRACCCMRGSWACCIR